jgi:hypothetical protein
VTQSPIEAAAAVHSALKKLTAEVDDLTKRNADQEAELVLLRAENLKISKRLARAIQIIGGLEDEPENVTRLHVPFARTESSAAG